MKRRAFLVSTAAFAAAGCVSLEGASDPTTTRHTTTRQREAATTTQTPTTQTEASGEQIASMDPNGDGVAQLGELRYFLEKDLTIESFRFVDSVIKIAYPHKATRKQQYIDRLAYVVGDYASHVAHDGVGERVEARTVDAFGDTETEYYIERSWAETYNTDESVTGEDLMAKVLEENNISTLA